MLGKTLGSLRNVPSPPAAVLEEALKLLLTFGDSKSLGALLEQVREVQVNNERVFDETQKVLADLRVAKKSLEDSQEEYAKHTSEQNSAISRRADELVKYEASFKERIENFNQKEAASNVSLSQTKSELDRREQLIRQREVDYANKVQELSRKETDINQKASILTEARLRLEVKERKLRAVMDEG